MSNQEQPESTPAETQPARRAYKAPVLRELGSVREVTWGGSPRTIQESTFTRGNMKM